MRWLLTSKILLGNTDGNIDLPLFSRYFTSIDMVIFFFVLVSLLFALVFLSGDGVPGAASRLVFAARQRVCVALMSRRLCVFCHLQRYFASFVVDFDALVARDLRHEFA